jgi:hypothetical protein
LEAQEQHMQDVYDEMMEGENFHQDEVNQKVERDLNRPRLEKERETFTERMSVSEYLKHFPNPKKYFESQTDGNKDLQYQKQCLAFLKMFFPITHAKTITDIQENLQLDQSSDRS